MFGRKKRRRRLNLALQGGGAHGAFTWGVLDTLLDDDDIEIGWLSGTSAGAVNALAVAHGLAHGDRQLGRNALAAIWQSVEQAGVPDLLRNLPFFSSFAKAASMTNITSLLSPYDFNPLGFDPLRDILEQHIDFEAVRRNCPVELMIAATDVATGHARLFRKADVSPDVVLASACLPNLHRAVRIGNRHYWDGGFSANPALVDLAVESPVGDSLLVLLNPTRVASLPRSPSEIEDRVNTITFNQSLLRDVKEIVAAQSERRGWFSNRESLRARLGAHRFHLIAAGRHTAGLTGESKALPDNGVLTYLHGAGRLEALRWLKSNKTSIGRRDTAHLGPVFLGDVKEPDGLPVVSADHDEKDLAVAPELPKAVGGRRAS